MKGAAAHPAGCARDRDTGRTSSSVGFSGSDRNSPQFTGLSSIGVPTVVGFTELIRIECSASSRASVRISPVGPASAAP
ncbi:MAG: hypothetical protein ABS81_09000 [Pseudonocardia sp. SCN 72-86]|nr:MAG: hypothetical protein ABS81_09000 [Pseudonocardia sp. SCN 72-86]